MLETVDEVKASTTGLKKFFFKNDNRIGISNIKSFLTDELGLTALEQTRYTFN